MKKVLREEIAKQRKLMNLSEQSTKSFSDQVYDYVVGGLKSFFTPDEEEADKPKQEKKGNFSEISKKIIEKIEGGYYHPNMVRDGRLRSAGAMGDSGETMFGIDRKKGGEINDTAEGKLYWKLIDNAGASKKWPWNYRGGNLESRLTILAIKMMEDAYKRMSERYLEADAKKIVDTNEGLLTHFAYATWNGPGWFKRFADSINDEVKKGVKDPKKLLTKALKDRKTAPNRLIADSAEKIEGIIGTNLV